MGKSSTRLTMISDDYALAIGHFCMCWNLLEQTQLMMQWSLIKGDPHSWTAAYAGLSNQARCDLTSQLLKKSNYSPKAKSLTEEFLIQFSIVNENRNILLHSVVDWDDKGIHAIQKFSKTHLGQYVKYSYSLSDVQRCLVEAEQTLLFGTMTMVNELLNKRNALQYELASLTKIRAGEQNAEPPPTPIPLPEKPPRPNKLTPLLPEDRQGGSLQPLSFDQSE